MIPTRSRPKVMGDPPMQRRARDPHPGGCLNDARTRQHRTASRRCSPIDKTISANPDSATSQRPPRRRQTQSADHGHCRASTGGRMSRITWHSTTALTAELCRVTCDASVPPDVRHLA